ncbi:MAG: hypothetical protein IT349_06990 [Candidatus Eisenbacteria bacterium]|nr:hypothetical protein [Candidatus Eisenbacteria bacterium]
MFARLPRIWHWTTLLFIVGLSLPSGCQKDAPTNPTPDAELRIGSVEVERSSLAAGDSTGITVQVVTGAAPGTPAAGAAVTFQEFSPLAAGTFSKTEALCDDAGRAVVTYRPTTAQSGTVTLKVKAGSDIEYVSLQVGSNSVAGTTLTFTTATGQTSLAADGVTTLSITVKAEAGVARTPVKDLRLTLVAGDQFVDLNKDGIFNGQDQLGSTGDRNGNRLWDPEGVLPEAVTTDVNGRATFLYRSGPNVGNVYLKATGLDATADFTLYQHPTTLQVQMEPEGRELLADGVSTVMISVGVLDWGGGSIGGVVVKFVAGEPFTDADKDGYYTPTVDSYEDANHNGRWDAIGSIQSVATTNTQGETQVQYTAGLAPGEVTIRATTSNGASETSLRLVAVPPAGTLEFDLGATSSVYADGVSEVPVNLVVRDINGFPLSGKKVLLTAGENFRDVNLDGIWTAGTDVLLGDQDGNGTWTAMGVVPTTVTTGGEGDANFDFRAGTLRGTVYIHATADQSSGAVPLELRALPNTLSMEVAAANSNIKVYASGGEDNTTITANCNDAAGNPVPAGVPVVFTIARGPGGGEKIDGWTNSSYATTTNANGVASAVLVSGTKPGVVEVRASSGNTVRSTNVYVGAGPAAKVVAHALASQIDFWSSTTIEAAVQDAYGNAVEDGSVVRFRVDEGVMIGGSGAGYSETVDGIATATYQSLGPAANTDYRAVVTIEPDNSIATTSVNIQLGQGQAVSISSFDMETDRNEINVQGVGGSEEAVIRALGKDASGRAIGAGYTVSFSIAEGPNAGERLNSAGWGPVNVLTDADGWAQVRLRSGSASGPIEVRASATGATSRSLYLAIASGAVATLECYADSSRLGENSSCEIKAYLYDSANNPVPDGTVVYFTADEGIVLGSESAGSALSVDGQATATYQATLADEAGDGIAEITCSTANGVSCTTEIAVQRGPSAVTRLTLDADLSEIGVQGTGAAEQVRIRARGYDSFNRAVRAGVDVSFEITQGPSGGEHFLNAGAVVTAKTDASGQAEVMLQSGTVSGTVVVTASAGNGSSNHTSVAIAAGPPYYLYLGHENCNVKACDRTNEENQMVALVSDIYRNPVRDNTVIYWTADKGVVEGEGGLGSSVTSRGQCAATWRSGDSCGLVTVTGSTLGGTLVETNSFWSSDDPYSAEYVTPSASVVSLTADGAATFPILVDVRDWNGTYVLSTDVVYETDFGSIGGQENTLDGCSSSIARASYQSATLDRDWSYSVPDDGIGAVDNVVASAGFGGASDAIQVQLLTSASYKENCELNAEGSVAPGESFVFNAKLADRYSNPLGGHVLSITTTGGTVTTSATTDLWGVAEGMVYQAPMTPGTYTITVVDVDPNYSGGLVMSVSVTVE